MSQRKKFLQRCSRCLMRNELCICLHIPSFTLATRLIIISRSRELKAPSNTARLAALALKNSVLLVRGDRDQTYDLTQHLMYDRPSFLLYPDPNAPLLSDVYSPDQLGGCNLIVPDGNWRQTSKMRRRDPTLAQIPTVRIATGAASAYRIRKETKGQGLATLEAIARALGDIEGLDVQKGLEQLLHTMVQATLKARGIQDHTDNLRAQLHDQDS